MNAKKLLVITIVLFVFASGGLVTYNFFLKNDDETPPDGEETKEKALELKIKAISSQKVISPTIGQDGQTIKYYLKDNGQVFESKFDGSELKPISTANLPSLTKAIWSPEKTKVITFFGKEGAVKKTFFNYETSQSVQLHQSIKSVAFSPSGQKIAYQFQSPDGLTNNISLANPDGSNWKNIFPTRLEDLTVAWPSPDKISLTTKSSGLAKGSLFAIEIGSGNFTKILTDLYGLAANWSPDGQQILYQATNEKGKNLKLYLATSGGTQPQELPIATLAEKCVWSRDGRIIFCAVPQKLSENAVWPDDYWLGRVTLKDDFFLVDLATKEKIKIAESNDQQSFDAQELLLSPQEDYLFFINRKDGLLYSVKLDLK